MAVVFQSMTCRTSRRSRSMTYTPPWLSPWWLPRTTDVVTSFTIDTGADPAARSSAKPRQRHHFLLKDSPIVRGRCSDLV